MRVKFDIRGNDELMNVMNRAYTNAPKSSKKVLQNTAEKGKTIAQRKAPRDSWFMHDHIVAIHNTRGSKIHSPARYSGYVNFGTRYMSAQPFFSDMFEEVQQILISDMTDVAEGLLR